MRVLAWVHMYPNAGHYAGAELMLQAVLEDLERRGHATKVFATHAQPEAKPKVGKPVYRVDPEGHGELFDWADIVITHLDETPNAIKGAHARDLPVVHLVHNAVQLQFFEKLTGAIFRADLAVFNAEATRKATDYWGENPTLVVRPPVFVDDYRVDASAGDAYTLVSYNLNKGGNVVTELARRMPEQRFLMVAGAYGKQYIPTGLPNVERIENGPDMAAVYAETRLLLMPSEGETWGRCAVEAACSGIPTVAHKTPGIREAMGSAAFYVHSLEPNYWEEAIAEAEAGYAKISKAARDRAAWQETEARKDLEVLERRMVALVG